MVSVGRICSRAHLQEFLLRSLSGPMISDPSNNVQDFPNGAVYICEAAPLIATRFCFQWCVSCPLIVCCFPLTRFVWWRLLSELQWLEVTHRARSFLPSSIGLVALHSFVRETPTTVFAFTPAKTKLVTLISGGYRWSIREDPLSVFDIRIE